MRKQVVWVLVNKFSHIKKTPRLKIDVLLFENDNGMKKKNTKFYHEKKSFMYQISSSISSQVIKTHLEMHKNQTKPSCFGH